MPKQKNKKKLWPSYVMEVRTDRTGLMFSSMQPPENIERKAKKHKNVSLKPCSSFLLCKVNMFTL